MPTVQLPFEAILEATEKLNLRELDLLVQRVDELQRRKHEEERLLAIWNAPNLPLERMARLEWLCQIRDEERISDAERGELLRLNEEGNEVLIQRLQAVIELAHLRGVEPKELSTSKSRLPSDAQRSRASI